MLPYDVDFDLVEELEKLKKWIKDQVGDCTVIIGISGGTDSTVVSKLLVDVLGKDKVIGVLMPNQFQRDIDVAKNWVAELGIKNYTIDIFKAYNGITTALNGVMTDSNGKTLYLNDCYMTNTPARIRMTVLYGIAALYGNARVVNTCNLSEDWVGYSTKFGDAAGDFSPLSHFTKTEVREIGRLLGIREELVTKTPEDGMSHLSDEEKLGFTYNELDHYIRLGWKRSVGKYLSFDTAERIESMHKANLHKLLPMPSYLPGTPAIIQ